MKLSRSNTLIRKKSPPPVANWLSRYAPESISDVAVHPRKLSELQSTISRMIQFHTPKILIVSGPAGLGKTTAVYHTIKKLGLDVLEWINPLSTPGTLNVALFPDFLRGASYATDVAVLVEDLPALHHDDTRNAFQDALFEWAHQDFVSPPLIVIVADEPRLSVESAIGPQVLRGASPGRVVQIRFNPVNTTLMKKALGRIVKEHSSRFRGGAATRLITELAASGDIRAAILAMEHAARTKVSAEPIIRFGRGPPMDWFHVAGRVLYGSQKITEEDLDAVSEGRRIRVARNHLVSQSVLKQNPQLSENAGLLSLFIRENGTSFTSSIDKWAKLTDVLLECDTLNRFELGNTDILLNLIVRAGRCCATVNEVDNEWFERTKEGEEKRKSMRLVKRLALDKLVYPMLQKNQRTREETSILVDFYRASKMNNVTFKDASLYHSFYDAYINSRKSYEEPNMLVRRLGGDFGEEEGGGGDLGRLERYFKRVKETTLEGESDDDFENDPIEDSLEENDLESTFGDIESDSDLDNYGI